MRILSMAVSALVLAGLVLSAQEMPPIPERRAPIYKITVEQRAITAINYGHRAEPTKIDFKGTVLAPKAHGEATVESGHGPVKIRAKIKDLDAPTKFGAQFLTYVLWAITPDGRASNLGEIVTNSKDDARIMATTSFQSFGLVVTAEPYSSVTEPSDLVVLENIVRPGTEGTVEQVQAKYELLPRGSYTLNIGAPGNNPPGPMVSQHEYDALLAVYEAQNAVQIARSARADVYAADVLGKAEDLLNQARSLNAQKGESKQIVTIAREAAQRAEDARVIAVRKKAELQGTKSAE